MKNLVLIIIMLTSITAFAKKPTVKKHAKEVTSSHKPNLDKLVENYSSYYRVNAKASYFKAKLTTRDAKQAKAKKQKKLAKKAKPPQVPIQKFSFKLNVIQEDIRQVKFGVINLGEKIRDDVAQRYCNDQNLKLDHVIISLISSEEIETKREIKFWVSGSCIKYRYNVAGR